MKFSSCVAQYGCWRGVHCLGVLMMCWCSAKVLSRWCVSCQPHCFQQTPLKTIWPIKHLIYLFLHCHGLLEIIEANFELLAGSCVDKIIFMCLLCNSWCWTLIIALPFVYTDGMLVLNWLLLKPYSNAFSNDNPKYSSPHQTHRVKLLFTQWCHI